MDTETHGRPTPPLGDIQVLAQPGDRSIRALHDYWTGKRGVYAVPMRKDVDPIELKDHLSSLFMLDVLDGGLDFRYRLVGTMIAEMSGRDVTGAKLSKLYHSYPDALAKIAKLFGPVISERRPVFAQGTVFGCRSGTSAGSRPAIFLCRRTATR